MKMKNFLKNVRQFNKAFKTRVQYELISWYCPVCSPKAICPIKPSARFSMMKDEKYHRYKFFVKCDRCKMTTPAYEDPRVAEDAWEELCIAKEIEAVLGEEN